MLEGEKALRKVIITAAVTGQGGLAARTSILVPVLLRGSVVRSTFHALPRNVPITRFCRTPSGNRCTLQDILPFVLH